MHVGWVSVLDSEAAMSVFKNQAPFGSPVLLSSGGAGSSAIGPAATAGRYRCSPHWFVPDLCPRMSLLSI